MEKETIIEAIGIMQNLLSYGRIHTVNGVRYPEGTHEEMLNRAEEWLYKARQIELNQTKK